MRFKTTLFTTIAIMCLSACGSNPEQPEPGAYPLKIEVSPSATTYSMDQEIMVVFTNEGDRTVGYVFACSFPLEGQKPDSSWEQVWVFDCSTVRAIPGRLEPGELAEYRFGVPVLGPAKLAQYQAFRWRLDYSAGTDLEKSTSASFQLAAN